MTAPVTTLNREYSDPEGRVTGWEEIRHPLEGGRVVLDLHRPD
jgi:hypothetical protein